MECDTHVDTDTVLSPFCCSAPAHLQKSCLARVVRQTCEAWRALRSACVDSAAVQDLPLLAMDPDIEAMIAILPAILCLTICRAAAWIVKKVPETMVRPDF